MLASRMSERRESVPVVDRDAEVRELLAEALQHYYHVLRAATGEVALQLMEKEGVELMLLDVHLAGISGIEVLKITKENYPYVEVIVISATKELDVAIEALRCLSLHPEELRHRWVAKSRRPRRRAPEPNPACDTAARGSR